MLYQFQIELSDVSSGVYESLNFRTAQHPSESIPYLLTRVLAFALCYQPNLEFSPLGLGDPQTPALWSKDNNESIELWIEIGNPSPKKLHKAAKTSKQVKVFTYKNPKLLLDEIKGEKIHHASEIEIFSMDAKFLQNLESALQKSNKWTLLHQEGQLDLGVGPLSLATELQLLKIE